MAIFNTLEGGYYGKLGQTVGQRWKNLRTLRTYVIPHNPRTPVQQANRGKFGGCVPYAQIAMQMNKKTTAFDTSKLTLWNCRMSTARALQSAEQTELNLIPLYPQGFSVPYTISAANITEIIDLTHFKVTVEGNLPEEERVLMLLLMADGEGDWLNRLYLCKGQNSSEDYSTFTMTIPETPPSWENMQGRFVSCDDTDSATDLIGSGQIEVQLATVDEHQFDTTITNISRGLSSFTFTFAENYQNGTNVIENVSLSCVVRGAVVTLNVDNPTLINNGGKFAISVPFTATDGVEIPALPSGSYLSIGSVASTSSLVIATAENVTATAVDESDLVREFTTAYDVAHTIGSPKIRFKLNASPTLVSSATASVEQKDSPKFYFETNTGTRNVAVSGNFATIDLLASGQSPRLAFEGSYIKPLTAIDLSAGGVTYRIGTKEYSYNSTEYPAYVECEMQSEFQSDRFFINMFYDLPSAPPSVTDVVFNGSGRVGATQENGQWACYATYVGLNDFNFVLEDCSIELEITNPTFITEGEVGYAFYPNPLNFTITSGGKNYQIAVSSGDEWILVQDT